MKKNSVIFAQSLIESMGENKVIELLKNDVTLLTFWEVDSLGRIMKFDKLISKKELPKNFMDSIEDHLIKNNKRFFICFEKLPGYNESDSYKIITKDFYKNNKSHMINVAFPGELLLLHDYEKEEANSHCGLSKYRILKKQIKKYNHLSP
ncbi:MAG: hypothetical protein KBB71_11880 [Lentimicrobiaceae bacterium]|nr:hypothetical protein [Lentimicrobiaceae bacterium]